MATIATHNGSKICRDHNIRNPKVIEKEKHIDPNGVYEIWHDEKIREAYRRIFGEAQREYNERQTREDRKIQSYYNRVAKDSKKHVGYEMIVGVYGKEVNHEIGKGILREFVADWKLRNPTLELIGAYYHADEEGQPHVHVDYIPVGHGYVKGMAVQNGLNKALEEIGFKTISKAETAQIQWERRENQHLEKLCRERGIDVERPTGEKKEHEETEKYKLRQTMETLENDVENLEEKKAILESEIESLRAQKGPIGRVGPLRHENDVLRQEKAVLEDTVREVKEKLAEKEIDVKELKAKIEDLQPSMDDYIKEIENMQEKERLQRTVEWLRKVLEEIKKFLQEYAPAVYKALQQTFERVDREDHER